MPLAPPPQRLLQILHRHLRPHEPRKQQLKEALLLACTDPAAFQRLEKAWGAAMESALCSPHWMSYLFPDTCADVADFLPAIRQLANVPAMPPPRQEEAMAARQAWIAEQGNANTEQSLFSSLLSDLEAPDPSGGPHFAYLSRYYAFFDLLAAQLLNPGQFGIVDGIFRTLALQRQNWQRPYCYGYPYQGMESLGISGIKPAQERLRRYPMAQRLKPTDRILDIGSNCGFLALSVAPLVEHVHGIEFNPYLVQVATMAAKALAISNADFDIGDFTDMTCTQPYDAVLSLANHCTIDGNLAMDFEAYAAKLFAFLKPGGWLFFESHNVFGPGAGQAGDDGDLERKFELMAPYFELVEHRMTRCFVPFHDIDKLFAVFRRRGAFQPRAQMVFELASARQNYPDS